MAKRAEFVIIEELLNGDFKVLGINSDYKKVLENLPDIYIICDDEVKETGYVFLGKYLLVNINSFFDIFFSSYFPSGGRYSLYNIIKGLDIEIRNFKIDELFKY